MDCSEFAERIGEFVDRGTGDEAHCASCPDCARRLERARQVAHTLETLPRERIPDLLSRSVAHTFAESLSRYAPTKPPRPWIRHLIRVAAVLVLLAAAGGLTLLDSGRSYRPLELKVIEVDADGSRDTDLAFEHIYGPGETSLVANGER